MEESEDCQRLVGKARCLTSGAWGDREQGEQSDGLNVCATTANEEYEMISIMTDSGASGTVASSDHCGDYPLVQTTASGTTYASAAANATE